MTVVGSFLALDLYTKAEEDVGAASIAPYGLVEGLDNRKSG